MVVVGSLKLILDDHSVAVLIFGHEINLEVTGKKLPLRIGQ